MSIDIIDLDLDGKVSVSFLFWVLSYIEHKYSILYLEGSVSHI